MEAIKKMGSVKNSTLLLTGLGSLNNQDVEVIILPVRKNKMKGQEKKYPLKGSLLHYYEPSEPVLDPSEWNVNR